MERWYHFYPERIGRADPDVLTDFHGHCYRDVTSG